MAKNFKWTKDECRIAFCLALLDVSSVDIRIERFSQICGVSPSAIQGKLNNYKNLLTKESAPKKDTTYYEEEFSLYDKNKCHEVLAMFFYKNMGVINEVHKSTPRVRKDKMDSEAIISEKSAGELLTMFEEELGIRTKDDMSYYDEAFEAFKNNNLQLSHQILVDNITTECCDANVWNLLGMVVGRQGDHKQAYTYFKNAFNFDSSNFACLMNYLTSCVAMSYTEEYFISVLKIMDYLEVEHKRIVMHNFFEGIKNGAIDLLQVPFDFYKFALLEEEPADVICFLRDQLIFTSLKVDPSIAAKTLPIDTDIFARWLMIMGYIFEMDIAKMRNSKIDQLITDSPFHSGLFDGGADKVLDYIKGHKPMYMNCYLLQLYTVRISQVSERVA